MTTQLTTISGAVPEPVLPVERGEVARVLILGGVEAHKAAFRVTDVLRQKIAAQELRVGALHEADLSAAAWLTQAGVELIALAGMRNESADASALGFIGATAIGAGETEAMANRPFIRCVNGIRLGVVSYGEQRAGAFSGCADILSLMAYDQVRSLLSQCDHVVVLIRTGLDAGELPLPEWRARYRRFIDAGASIVVDTGSARGWEVYKHGLVFYGLGSPVRADSLGLFLTLRRNGLLDYEVRALSCADGLLDFSENDAFRAKIDAQNTMFFEDTAYKNAADQMCLRLYCARETAQKRGVLGLFVPHADEEERLLSLLENESLRLMTLRAIRCKRAAENAKRENAKKP
ncbi:MAG: CapA family protein [Eubacteriales bacterium]|jgi:hypothetical protein|nr:CapA family protein [Eubacteriales bacterium]